MGQRAGESVRRGSGRGWALAAVALAVATGCAKREYVVPLAHAVPDPQPSPASALRSFEPISAEYENTAIVAWSTRFAFVDADNQTDATRPLVEPAIFLGNLLALPVAVIIEPPFVRQHAWRPVGLAPTQTAAVPLSDVFVVTEGAIVPAPKPSVNTGGSTSGGSKGTVSKRPSTAKPDDEWTELVPVRTPRGVILVEPGAEPIPVEPTPAEPATQPEATSGGFGG